MNAAATMAVEPLVTAPEIVITLAQLKAAGACHFEVALFKVKFGKSVIVTEAVAIEVADCFDWGWAASNLLTAPALAEYEKVRAPALAEYEKVRAPALAEYEKITAPAWAEYEKITAPAWAEYEKVRAPALAEYEKITAVGFVRLYIAQGGAK